MDDCRRNGRLYQLLSRRGEVKLIERLKRYRIYERSMCADDLLCDLMLARVDRTDGIDENIGIEGKQLSHGRIARLCQYADP